MPLDQDKFTDATPYSRGTSDVQQAALHKQHSRFDGVAIALGAIALCILTAVISQPLSPFILVGILFALLVPFREYKASRILMFTAGGLFSFWLILSLTSLLLPFIIALVIAYLFNPVVTYLEEKKRIGRGWSSAVIILLLMLLLYTAGYFFLPIIIDQIQAIVGKIVGYIQQSNFTFDEEGIRRFFVELGVPQQYVTQYVDGEFIPALKRMLSEVPNHLFSIVTSIPAILERLIYVIVIPISAIYFLKDWKKMTAAVFELIPKTHKPRWSVILKNIDKVLYAYIRGQSTVAFIIGVLAGILFMIVGIPYAIILALIIMFLDLIPVIGLIVSIVFVEIVIMLTMPLTATNILSGILIIGGLHTLEAYVIGPKIVGKGVGIPPLAIIIAVFVFGYYMGFLGMLIAVPLAGVIILFAREYRQSIETFANTPA